MSEQIYSQHCPLCGRRNWINNGDVTDLTKQDVEAYRCWNCESISWVGEDGELEDVEATEPEDAYWVEGLEVVK